MENKKKSELFSKLTRREKNFLRTLEIAKKVVLKEDRKLLKELAKY